ncbi:hypothetical protein ACFV2L_35130 [Streptomyces sp. NPDC059687]|uniref:RipA family octameric membrane protein n=1 Tax=Streptomyces sp. NPDC059687 TaxID=3346905 RepID=UPI0036AFE21E
MTDRQHLLWNPAVSPSDYSTAAEKYQGAILEQYRLCVEMADRVSSRRNLANTFFLSVNTAVVAAVAALAGQGLSSVSRWVLAAGLVILLSQCAAWWAIVRSYRQLNAAKWQVIGLLEERLPAFAYSRAEWILLGEGRDWRRYLPLTHVEQWVPVIFAASYVLGSVALVWRQ